MNDEIRHTAMAGLLCAAHVQETRCDAVMPEAPGLSAQGSECLEAAARLAAHDKTPGKGLQALASAFGHLDGRKLSGALGSPWAAMQGHWQAACPAEHFGFCLDRQELEQTSVALQKRLEAAMAQDDFAALDRACEDILSFLPLLPGDPEDGDISLYDYGRLTAALACCFQLRMQAPDAPDECQALCRQQSLLLFSCDFSGIQNFIYLISTKSALKMLRSRSFFLELLMEHMIDELLELCGLTRVNCLYAGGGHAYLLLPNTPQAVQAVKTFSASVNSWLRGQFGIALYLACGAQPCSPDALFGRNGQEAYSDIFRSLSARLGHTKLTRCSAAELDELNHAASESRECRICGRGAADGEELCIWCDIFSRLGARLTDQHLIFAVAERPLALSRLSMPAPGAGGVQRYINLFSKQQALAQTADPSILRWYSKNETIDGLANCRRVWMGDHCPSSLLEDLSSQSEGIQRMGVFRADVDNLGKAFISGFASPDGKSNHVSLARTMAFSRSMSLFFKSYINELLAPYRGVLVVYSGGDDLFLVGGWNDLLEAAQKLRSAFCSYTGDALTFSGGFGLYTSKYPLARAAEETAELESFAKEASCKNSITLFAPAEELRFDWPTFQTHVMGEKYDLLQAFFSKDENDRGNAFLYQLLEYLRAASDRLNLARCAYLLARLRPGEKATKDQKRAYAEFSQSFYGWALQPEERRRLVAAIYLYVYLNRTSDR